MEFKGVDRGGKKHSLGKIEFPSGKTVDIEAQFETVVKADEDAMVALVVTYNGIVESLRNVVEEYRKEFGTSKGPLPYDEMPPSLQAVWAEVRPEGPPPCPECASGKHGNCTEQVLVGDTDEWEPCPCKEAGHDE